MQAQQHSLDVLRQGPQAEREFEEIDGEPAGGVERVDDRPPDQPVPGVRNVEHQLTFQTVAQAGRRRHALFRAGRAAVENAGAAGNGGELLRHT